MKCQGFGLDPLLFSIGMLRELVMTFLCTVILHPKRLKIEPMSEQP